MKTCKQCGGAILTGVNGYGGKICMCAMMQPLTRDWKETIAERVNKDAEFKEALAEQLSGNSEPLSDDEIHNIADHSFQFARGMFDEIFAFARAIERAHGIGE